MVYLCFDKDGKFLDAFDNSNIAKASFARTYGIISIIHKDGDELVYKNGELVGFVRPTEVKNHTELFHMSN